MLKIKDNSIYSPFDDGTQDDIAVLFLFLYERDFLKFVTQENVDFACSVLSKI